MVSYLRSSDCTIIYEFPHVVSHRVRQVDHMLSVLSKDVELNVQERQVVSVNDLRLLSAVNHIVDDGLDIIDGVDAEVLDQVLLGFPLLSSSEDG